MMPSSGFYSDTYQDAYGSTFAAPTENTGAWVTYGSKEAEDANLLWRHYGTRTVGRNIYVLTDGTVTEIDPDGQDVTFTADVRTVFWGGHSATQITDEDRAALVAAGYTVIDG